MFSLFIYFSYLRSRVNIVNGKNVIICRTVGEIVIICCGIIDLQNDKGKLIER